MTNHPNFNAPNLLSQVQPARKDVFPRPLREWILQISRRVNSSKEKRPLSEQEDESF